ncbi:MAG: hypothetical protein IJZ06_08580 [Bacteroidales bacterium]|nr:hypothetical protein [Bacteroidales bacterium]
MKKINLLALLFLALIATSCGGGLEDPKIDKTQIVGKWMTPDEKYFEVYYSDGTGKFWDLKDDVTEEEASKFTWEFDEGADNKFFQYHEMEIGGAIVPQYCNILELTATNFRYNNDGFRATYNLIRAE